MTFCKEGTLADGKTIDSATNELLKTISELNAGFFVPHGEDKEIQGLKEEAKRKLSELSNFFQENNANLKEKGFEVEVNAGKIANVVRELSE